MDGWFPSGERRRVTYNRNGLVKYDVAPTMILQNGNIKKDVLVDGAILISTDAASKITERAIGRAFDKWAEDSLKDSPEKRLNHESKSKATQRQNGKNVSKPVRTPPSEKRTSKSQNKQS